MNFADKIQSISIRRKIFPILLHIHICQRLGAFPQKKSDWFESDFCVLYFKNATLLTMVDNKLFFKQPVKSA